MERSDNFAGGFVAGALFGSVVGGVLGTLLASRLPTPEENLASSTPGKARRRKPHLKAATELNIEEARQGLEVKIAQLNEAIDDVRRQLSNVNGNGQEAGE